jgi:enterobactin synthetase component D
LHDFDLSTPHGCLASARLAAGHEERAHEHPGLHPDEARRAAELRGARRTGFVAGRLAAARALARAGAPRVAIASDARGAPCMPAGFVGSISHKGELGVSLAARDDGARIGVDVEAIQPVRDGIDRYVLTEDERARLPADPEARARAVLASFSVKESIYKAIDPFVRRWVGYHEATLELPAVATNAWARVLVRMTLSGGERLAELEAFVMEREGYLLSTARARSAAGGGA